MNPCYNGDEDSREKQTETSEKESSENATKGERDEVSAPKVNISDRQNPYIGDNPEGKGTINKLLNKLPLILHSVQLG